MDAKDTQDKHKLNERRTLISQKYLKFFRSIVSFLKRIVIGRLFWLWDWTIELSDKFNKAPKVFVLEKNIDMSEEWVDPSDISTENKMNKLTSRCTSMKPAG